MFKKEFKNGIITLSASGIDRGKVLVGNSEGRIVTLLEGPGRYDWGYAGPRSRNLAYDVLVAILENPEDAARYSGNFEVVAIATLNPSRFEVKIHVSDIISSLGNPNIKLSNKSASHAAKHAFSFILINISKPTSDPVYVSKFLDFVEVAGKATEYGENTIQAKMYKELDDETKKLLHDYLGTSKVGIIEHGSVTQRAVSLEELHNPYRLKVSHGVLTNEKAEKLIVDSEILYMPKW